MNASTKTAANALMCVARDRTKVDPELYKDGLLFIMLGNVKHQVAD